MASTRDAKEENGRKGIGHRTTFVPLRPLSSSVSLRRRGPTIDSTIQATKFPQQFLRAFVEQLRQHDTHFDDEIAARAAARRRQAALAQAEALARLRARRNPQPRGAVERRDVDLRAERRLVNANRDLEAQVVA